MAGRRPGPAPQTEKREQFARLIARGVSNAEACRTVGVNRRTGKRWRHGRTITSSSGARLHYRPFAAQRRAAERRARPQRAGVRRGAAPADLGRGRTRRR